MVATGVVAAGRQGECVPVRLGQPVVLKSAVNGQFLSFDFG